MNTQFENEMEKYKKSFESLSEFDRKFIDSLAMFGGACSRRDAAIAMGFKSVDQANGLLDRLTQQKFLTRRICTKVDGYPVIYFLNGLVTEFLGAGWYQFKNMNQVVGRVYRYSVATLNRGRNIWSYRFGIESSPVNKDLFRYLASNLIDCAFARYEKLMLVDTIPTDDPNVIAGQLETISHLDSQVKFELWSSTTKHIDRVYNLLPKQIQNRVVKKSLHIVPLCTAYDKSVEQARYAHLDPGYAKSIH